MKKRLIALCLALCLIFAEASAEKVFAPETAKEGKRQAVQCLLECGFSSEYGGDDKLSRWEEDISIYIGGEATREDIEKVDSFIMELSFRIPFLPPITRVEEENDANVKMYFVPLDEMGQYVGGYEEGNWGFGTHYWMDYVRYEGEVGVCSDVTNQIQRNHLIMEELIAVIGMTNDHYCYEDSIIYQPWTETQELSELDWLMLNMMYHPHLAPGMTAEEAEGILMNIIE